MKSFNLRKLQTNFYENNDNVLNKYSALTLFVGRHEGHLACTSSPG